MKYIQLHKQALKTSTLLTLVLFVLFTLFYYFFDKYRNYNYLFILFFIVFIIIFLIYKISVKQFIFRQLKKVYKSSLFENEPSLINDNIETDFESFLQKIKEFTDIKHQEIKKLHNRDDFRREFLGDVSHELKTPLFTAQGYILTLLDDSLEDEELQKKYLERANKSIERLNFIVKDLDMIAKLESGMKLNFESFNIIKLISDVFDILEIKAGRKNISVAFDKVYEFPILVYGDKERIEQVLINLISNSINYGKNNGATLIGIESYSSNQLIIKVADDGVGIDSSAIPRIFERFYRVDKSRSREQGGSGLGLAIVKHIVEAHSQKVFVKSKSNEGSTFSFTINKMI